MTAFGLSASKAHQLINYLHQSGQIEFKTNVFVADKAGTERVYPVNPIPVTARVATEKIADTPNGNGATPHPETPSIDRSNLAPEVPLNLSQQDPVPTNQSRVQAVLDEMVQTGIVLNKATVQTKAEVCANYLSQNKTMRQAYENTVRQIQAAHGGAFESSAPTSNLVTAAKPGIEWLQQEAAHWETQIQNLELQLNEAKIAMKHLQGLIQVYKTQPNR